MFEIGCRNSVAGLNIIFMMGFAGLTGFTSLIEWNIAAIITSLKMPEIKNTNSRTFMNCMFIDAIKPPKIAPKNTATPLSIEV